MAATCVRPHRRSVPAVQRRLTVDGVRHSIALCETHHRELQRALRELLEPYLTTSGAPVRPGAGTGTATGHNASPERAAENAAIRAWAAQQGLDAPRRGPIPRELRAAYEQRAPKGGPRRPRRGG